MNTIQKTGGCLCGETRCTANTVAPVVHACHCDMCRKWGGGPSLSVHCGKDVSFDPSENISVYDSSAWASRGFCKKCGSHLFYMLKEQKEYILPAGLFDSDEGFVLDKQIFIDEKPEYYCFANKTTNLTGAEVIAEATT